ncbi:MAG TPA: hypothetical protein VE912_18500, partial [Bacteroidales bacterium]|nr:hypothetical protein [Bacteroidales bacterium]
MDSYTIQVLYATFRLVIIVVILFVWIAPLYFQSISKYDLFDRIVLSWLGMGGLLLVLITLLSFLHLYDLISIVASLIMILIIKRVWKDEPNNLIDYLKKIENQVIFLHISFIESYRQSDSIITFKKVKKNLTQRHSLFIVAVLLIIIIGIVYIYKINAVFEYAEPLSREWFFNINRVKEIRLQNYFGNVPSAAGL